MVCFMSRTASLSIEQAWVYCRSRLIVHVVRGGEKRNKCQSGGGESEQAIVSEREVGRDSRQGGGEGRDR